MPSPTDYLNESLRTQLERKQYELTVNQKEFTVHRLDGKDKEAKAAAAACRRNERSIALLVSKLLCEHTTITRSVRINGSAYAQTYCTKCKGSNK